MLFEVLVHLISGRERQHLNKKNHSIEFYSHKNASTLSDEYIELISKEKPSHVNLSKNKFTEMPLA